MLQIQGPKASSLLEKTPLCVAQCRKWCEFIRAQDWVLGLTNKTFPAMLSWFCGSLVHSVSVCGKAGLGRVGETDR